LDEERNRPSIKIDGDVHGYNLVMGGSQTVRGTLAITVGAVPSASDDLVAELRRQVEALSEALRAVPAGQESAAEEVQVAAQDAVLEVSRERPDAKRLRVRGAALRKAAEQLASIAPAVLAFATQVVATIEKFG
jgi:hypothetical protein